MGRNTRTITPNTKALPDRGSDPFVKGEDVGHGVDHDCDNCRAARRALSGDLSGIQGQTAGFTGAASPAEGMQSSGPPNPAPTAQSAPASPPAPKVDSRADQARAEQERLDRASTLGTSGVLQIDPQAGGVPVNLSNVIEQTEAEEKLWMDIERTTAQLLIGANEEDEARIIGGGLAAIDTLIAMHGAKVMLSNGFTIGDVRWHVELDFSGSRVLASHAIRDVAICLAVLKRFSPVKAAAYERQLTAFRPVQQPVGFHTGGGPQ